MKLSKVIDELEGIKKVYGDIECQLQSCVQCNPREEKKVVGYEGFFIVPEEYENETICNIRTWSH